MRNRGLGRDYFDRARHRAAALAVLFERESWADVVRESQEIVELALKSVLRARGVEVPRIHDVSDLLLEADLPDSLRSAGPGMAEISRTLRRDRELAFTGSEDLTPSEFYRREDAVRARESAEWVLAEIAGSEEDVFGRPRG